MLMMPPGTPGPPPPRRFDPEVKRKRRRLPMGLVGWISPTIFYPEDEVIALAGMDVAVFLRLLSYGARCCWPRRGQALPPACRAGQGRGRHTGWGGRAPSACAALG